MNNKKLKHPQWAATRQNQQHGCVPNEDSDQPGHPPSLFRVFAVRLKNLGPLTTNWAHSEDSDQTERMPRLILVSAGRTLSLLVLSCRSSNYSSSGPFLAVMLFGRNHCSSKTTTVISKCEVTWDNNWATSRETLSSRVCDLVRLKPACAVTEAS